MSNGSIFRSADCDRLTFVLHSFTRLQALQDFDVTTTIAKGWQTDFAFGKLPALMQLYIALEVETRAGQKVNPPLLGPLARSLWCDDARHRRAMLCDTVRSAKRNKSSVATWPVPPCRIRAGHFCAGIRPVEAPLSAAGVAGGAAIAACSMDCMASRVMRSANSWRPAMPLVSLSWKPSSP
jgi:hypothetical protein